MTLQAERNVVTFLFRNVVPKLPGGQMSTTITQTVYRSALPAPPIEPSITATALRHAAGDPSALAVVDGASGERLTRAELAARSAALAAGLRARGVGSGYLFALAMPNLAWWPVVALGVWRTGAVIEPLSPLWTAEESARVLSSAVPRAAIAFAPLAPMVSAALRSIGADAEVFVVGGEAEAATPIGGLLPTPGSDRDPGSADALAAPGRSPGDRGDRDPGSAD